MAAKRGNLNKDGASWNRSISFIKQVFFDFKNELLFPFAKIVNSSKDGIFLQFKRWSHIALSSDDLVFLNAILETENIWASFGF